MSNELTTTIINQAGARIGLVRPSLKELAQGMIRLSDAHLEYLATEDADGLAQLEALLRLAKEPLALFKINHMALETTIANLMTSMGLDPSAEGTLYSTVDESTFALCGMKSKWPEFEALLKSGTLHEIEALSQPRS